MSIDESALMSSGKDDWETPAKVLDRVHEMTAIIGLDPCAGPNTDLAVINWTEREDGLSRDWAAATTGLCFINPPYSQNKLWIPKVINESKKGLECVLLLPARTDTLAFQLAMRWSSAVCFIQGRLKFLDNGKSVKHSAPFPSAALYFSGERGRWASFVSAFDPLGHTMDRARGWFGFKAEEFQNESLD